MYLRKPVMMAPAHIEQECNAFDVSRQRWWICRGGF
jgi:hypothetical protein